MNLRIDYLANHPEWIPELASWFFDEWGRKDSDNSLEQITQRLRKRLHKNRAPLTLVGFLEDKAVASASIKIREMETHPQYKYWLGAVYIQSDYRGQGFGSQIVNHTVSIAAKLELSILYLYTHSHEGFYDRLGWVTIARPVFHGRKVALMSKSPSHG
jgi:GNAT superfamily N-acetyltransferase